MHSASFLKVHNEGVLGNVGELICTTSFLLHLRPAIHQFMLSGGGSGDDQSGVKISVGIEGHVIF
jgi:hypothetical protein